MATSSNITSFHYDEYVEITIAAKNRDGSIITTPASQKLTFSIAATAGGASVLSFNTTDDPTKVSLTDAGAGEFTIALLPSDLSSLTENQTYYYNIWTELSGNNQPLLQAKGTFQLIASIDYPVA